MHVLILVLEGKENEKGTYQKLWDNYIDGIDECVSDQSLH